LQCAGLRYTVQIVLPRDRCPERFLVVAADPARNIDPPGLLAGSAVTQRGERNAELGVPALLVSRRRYFPAAVPVLVETATGTALLTHGLRAAAITLACDLAIVLYAGRRRAEHKAVLSVEIRVKYQDDGVGIPQVRVPTRLALHNARRLPVEQPRADVQRALIVHDPDLCAFRYRCALLRLPLGEACQQHCVLPRCVIEHAIDAWR
jgi:hypothetical protein